MATPPNRKWLTLFAMTCSLSMVMIDQAVVSVALPRLQHDLGLSSGTVQWVVNGYLLALAALVAVGGRIGEIAGMVRTFVVGVCLFGVGSVMSGLAPNLEVLLAARALEGLGAALMQPASAVLVAHAFPANERGNAMAMYNGAAMLFLAVGPVLGGALTQFLSWRWVFAINPMLTVLALVLTARARPDSPPRSEEPLDARGAVLLVLGTSGLVLALQQSPVWGWTSSLTLTALVGGLALLVVFAMLQARTPAPLLDLGLFRSQRFSANTVVLFCVQFALVGQMVFGAIFLQKVLQFPPLLAGAAALPAMAMLLLVVPLSGKLYDRLGARPLVLAATAAVAGSFFLQGELMPLLRYEWLVPGMLLQGIGLGLVMAPALADALSGAPAAKRGQAFGVLTTFRQLGGTIGLAAIGPLVVFLLHGKTYTLAEQAARGPTEVAALHDLLVGAERGSAAAVETLRTQDPAALAALKRIVAESIGGGYRLGGAVCLAAFFLCLAMLPAGRPSEAAEHSAAPAPA